MAQIIQAFEAYFDSTLPKSDLAIRIALLILVFIVGVFLTYLFDKHILDKTRRNQLVKLKKENKALKKENEVLKASIKKYQKQIDMTELSLSDEDFDVALEEFIK